MLAPQRPHDPGWAAAIHPTLEYTTLPLTITATIMPAGHDTRAGWARGSMRNAVEFILGKRPTDAVVSPPASAASCAVDFADDSAFDWVSPEAQNSRIGMGPHSSQPDSRP